MELLFEFNQLVTATGNNPTAVHFEDQTSQVFYTGENGRLYGIDTTTPNGEWENKEFSSPLVVAPDININYVTLRRISRYGVYGSWESENRHRFAIYGVDFDVTDYIEDGNIGFAINNPISTMSFNLNNPSQIFMNEESSLVSPGSKVQFSFSAGDSIPYSMGQFYTDRGGYSVNNANIDIDGRNSIGKILKDQTFDENNTFSLKPFNLLVAEILEVAGLSYAKYFIDSRVVTPVGIKFPLNMTILDGLKETLTTVNNVKMQELLDGSIAIGLNDYSKFDQASKYTFYRNKDIFSRSITRDDMDTYRRVCVYTDEFTTKVYKDVSFYEGWSLGVQKTLYIAVAAGTTLADCTTYATQLASQLSHVGIIESFVGAFRPHIQPGDSAEIINAEGKSRLLGIITNVNHRFGKGGYSTDFAVDSGGQIGKGRISDYIDIINKKNSVSNATRLYI